MNKNRRINNIREALVVAKERNDPGYLLLKQKADERRKKLDKFKQETESKLGTENGVTAPHLL